MNFVTFTLLYRLSGTTGRPTALRFLDIISYLPSCLSLRHTKIFAPRDGSIAKRWVVAGDVVQLGTPIFSLTDTQNIWVTANLEETKISKIKTIANFLR